MNGVYPVNTAGIPAKRQAMTTVRRVTPGQVLGMKFLIIAVLVAAVVAFFASRSRKS